MTTERIDRIASAVFRANETKGVNALLVVNKRDCSILVDTPDQVTHEFHTSDAISKGMPGVVCVNNDTDLKQGEMFLLMISEGKHVHT